MRSHSFVLLASLVLAPSLLGCATSGSNSGHTNSVTTSVVLESTAPTTVFLETAGMDLTPPSECDDVAASAALVNVVYGEVETVRPACESACRVDTCRSMAVQAEVASALYDEEMGAVLPELAAHCEQSVDACMAVTEVVMFDGSIAELGFELPVSEDEDEDEVEDEIATDGVPVPPDPAVEAACEAGDAAACYALVDLDAVLMGYEEWPQHNRSNSLARWDEACKLEPMVYCRGLELAIHWTTDDEGCGG